MLRGAGAGCRHLEGARCARYGGRGCVEQEPVDIVVPISHTADFVRYINGLEASSGVRMIAFGHAGDGNVHLCVVRDGRDQQTWERELHDNMEQAYAKAYSYGA